jgi:hypothetical protein
MRNDWFVCGTVPSIAIGGEGSGVRSMKKLCPTCCADHGHRLRSAAGPYLWRRGLVRSDAYLAWEAIREARDRAVGEVFTLRLDPDHPIRRYILDHPPSPPPESDWLKICPDCNGTGFTSEEG